MQFYELLQLSVTSSLEDEGTHSCGVKFVDKRESVEQNRCMGSLFYWYIFTLDIMEACFRRIHSAVAVKRILQTSFFWVRMPRMFRKGYPTYLRVFAALHISSKFFPVPQQSAVIPKYYFSASSLRFTF